LASSHASTGRAALEECRGGATRPFGSAR
jgi:hypothetical protein